MKSNSRLVYFNEKFVNEKDAKISIYDSALMFGDMVFEMTRSFNGKQFKLKDHLQRLYSGIKILRIPVKLKIEEMEQAVYETVEKNSKLFNKNDEHRIMIDVSRGLLSIYEDVDGKNKRFSYKPNTVSNGHDPYPNVIPIGPIPHERPWWLEDDDESAKGLESLVASSQIPSASYKDQFDTYYRILSRYYTPRDLLGRSLKELDQMLQLHIKADGGLF